jgi:lipid A 3-O-deacylase
VARDIFLDGNTWRDSRSVDREPLVGDASLGAVLVLPWVRLTYTHTFRSKEYEGQRDRAQLGAVSLSFRF